MNTVFNLDVYCRIRNQQYNFVGIDATLETGNQDTYFKSQKRKYFFLFLSIKNSTGIKLNKGILVLFIPK